MHFCAKRTQFCSTKSVELQKLVVPRDFRAPIGANFDKLVSKAKLPAHPHRTPESVDTHRCPARIVTRKGTADLATEISAINAADDPGNSSPEIEFALVLSRMIDAAYGDPAQLRNSIYELARVKLRKEVLRGEVENEARLVNALDVAIRNVEIFSKREDQSHRFPPARSVTAQIARQTEPPPVLLIEQRSAPQKPLKSTSNLKTPRAIAVVASAIMLAGGAAFGVVTWNERGREQAADSSKLAVTGSIPGTPVVAQPVVPAPVAGEPGWPPLPTSYGVYALSNGEFQEIYSLGRTVPDKRIAISAPINAPSRTTLADGKVTFLIFRRDLVASAPEHVELRTVAKVMRAMKFEAGKPSTAPIEETWTIRSISQPFRVAPLPGNPEMMVLKSQQPDLTLVSGRYAVVIKGQGYDFTVAGPITDPSQCMEKVEAANGSFYSECKKL